MVRKATKGLGWLLTFILAAGLIYLAITKTQSPKTNEGETSNQPSNSYQTEKAVIDDNLQIDSNFSIGSDEAVMTIK